MDVITSVTSRRCASAAGGDVFRTLTAGDFGSVVPCFNEAFSDYAVRFSMTALQLREIVARRAVVFDLSVGAFDGGRLVGFTTRHFPYMPISRAWATT